MYCNDLYTVHKVVILLLKTATMRTEASSDLEVEARESYMVGLQSFLYVHKATD